VEERRRVDDKQWEKVNSYIDESREYRAALNVTLDYMKKTQEELAERVKIQNGRVTKIEERLIPLSSSDAKRGKIEGIVGGVVIAGVTATVGAVFIWAGKTLITAFRIGG
jgi:transcriptional regulator with XRE-family HTH domain